ACIHRRSERRGRGRTRSLVHPRNATSAPLRAQTRRGLPGSACPSRLRCAGSGSTCFRASATYVPSAVEPQSLQKVTYFPEGMSGARWSRGRASVGRSRFLLARTDTGPARTSPTQVFHVTQTQDQPGYDPGVSLSGFLWMLEIEGTGEASMQL